jgi:hypothetical protein
MSYADTLLAGGEHITLRVRQHWLAIVLEARYGILAIVGALLLLIFGSGLDPTGFSGTFRQLVGLLTLALFAFGLAQVALMIANWMTEEYIVTNRRVLKVDGLLNKHSADSSLEKINDAVLDQNLFGRIFHYGDLDILTASNEHVDKYRMLAGAVSFKIEMLNQKHELEVEQMRPLITPPLRTTPPAPAMTVETTMSKPAPPAAPGSAGAAAPQGRTMTPAEVTQTLAGLADLRDRGAITPQEFEAKKADLLGRL